MAVSFDDVTKLVKLMVDNKISLIEFEGVKIVKGLHDLPQEKQDSKKTPSDDDILFNPYKDM